MSYFKFEVDDVPEQDWKAVMAIREFISEIKQPITNADRIRAMSDEELATSHLIIPCFYDDGYGECTYGWHERKWSCEECKLEWLKQPAEVTDNDQ